MIVKNHGGIGYQSRHSQKYLHGGGWAPPDFFASAGYTEVLHEVPLDVLHSNVSQSEEEAVLASMPAVGLCVFVDGSADHLQGIAAGFFQAGVYQGTMASLALPGITCAEASELLGIILGLMEI